MNEKDFYFEKRLFWNLTIRAIATSKFPNKAWLLAMHKHVISRRRIVDIDECIGENTRTCERKPGNAESHGDEKSHVSGVFTESKPKQLSWIVRMVFSLKHRNSRTID
jgi:hypothetical protein